MNQKKVWEIDRPLLQLALTLTGGLVGPSPGVGAEDGLVPLHGEARIALVAHHGVVRHSRWLRHVGVGRSGRLAAVARCTSRHRHVIVIIIIIIIVIK